MYRTRAIISRGLYIFYPVFKDNFFVFKEVFSENSVLIYGLYSRAACNQVIKCMSFNYRVSNPSIALHLINSGISVSHKLSLVFQT